MLHTWTIFIVILYLFEFCLGISEAVLTARYKQYNDECDQILEWIIGACVVNIVIPVLTGLYFALNKNNGDIKCIVTITSIQFFIFGQVIIALWAFVIYL